VFFEDTCNVAYVYAQRFEGVAAFLWSLFGRGRRGVVALAQAPFSVGIGEGEDGLALLWSHSRCVYLYTLPRDPRYFTMELKVWLYLGLKIILKGDGILGNI
jgi:hypothetical protein